MGACAWMLGRSGWPPGRDAWAAVGGQMPLGRGAGDAALFKAGQNGRGWQVRAGNSLQINFLRPRAPSDVGGLDQHAAMWPAGKITVRHNNPHMTQYYPPTNNAGQFHCIHSGVYAKQRWGVLCFGYHSADTSPVTYCSCEHCQELSFWHEGRMIIPAEAPVAPPHSDMPEIILDEYQEARSIFARSPRAAVALLRLAVQKLMSELGEKGDNIKSDIKSLVSKGLPLQVQKALDYCRVVGNNAVHPGEINLNDTPEMGSTYSICSTSLLRTASHALSRFLLCTHFLQKEQGKPLKIAIRNWSLNARLTWELGHSRSN